MSTMRGKVWSLVLDAARYESLGTTAEACFAMEEAKASKIADEICDAVGDYINSAEISGIISREILIWGIAENLYPHELVALADGIQTGIKKHLRGGL